MERAPHSMVVEPQEESAPAGQQAPEPPIPVVPVWGSEAPVPQVALVATSLAVPPTHTLMPPPPQALALADCAPLVRPEALEEAYTTLGQLRTDLQGTDMRMAMGRMGLTSGWLQADVSVRAA